MKRTLTGLGIVLLFSFMLLSPKAVFSGGKQRTSALVSDNSPYIVSVSARLQSASRNRKHTLPYLCILKNLPDIPFRFRLRKFCRYHRIFVRISDGCQDRCRSEYTRIYHASGSLLSSLFLQQYKPCFYYELYRLSDTGRRNASAPHTVHPPCQSALCKSDHKMYLQNVAYRSCRKPKYVRAIRRFFHPCRRAVERARLFFPAARSLHHGQL